MPILRRDASLENTARELALRPASPEDSMARLAMIGDCGGQGEGEGGCCGPKARVRTLKRIDQKLGFLSGGITYFKVHVRGSQG